VCTALLQVLREKIYMHLNKEIPYNVRQKTQLLGVDAETGVLVCEQDLIVSTRSHQVLVHAGHVSTTLS
jgi:GTPase Era involved in 16S rRNA processing